MGYLHLELGETAACRTAFGRGMEAATTGAARGVLEAGTANLELRLHWMSGAERWVIRALRHLGPDDSSARCLALLIAAWTNGHRGDRLSAMAAFHDAEEMAARLPSRRDRWMIMMNSVHFYLAYGTPQESLQCARSVASEARSAKLMKSYELQAARSPVAPPALTPRGVGSRGRGPAGSRAVCALRVPASGWSARTVGDGASRADGSPGGPSVDETPGGDDLTVVGAARDPDSRPGPTRAPSPLRVVRACAACCSTSVRAF